MGSKKDIMDISIGSMGAMVGTGIIANVESTVSHPVASQVASGAYSGLSLASTVPVAKGGMSIIKALKGFEDLE